MSHDMSLPQDIPALQREIQALQKQLRRAEEDHRGALEKAGRHNREALEQAQQDLSRAHEDLQEAQDTVVQTLDGNRLLAQQLEDLQRSQTSAQESSGLRKELEELKKQHQTSAQESSELRKELEALKKQHQLDLHNSWIVEQKFRLHQGTSIGVYNQSLEKVAMLKKAGEIFRQFAQVVDVNADSLADLFHLALPVSDTAEEPDGSDAGSPQPTPLLQPEGIPPYEGEALYGGAASDAPASAQEDSTAEVVTDVATGEEGPQQGHEPDASSEDLQLEPEPRDHLQEAGLARPPRARDVRETILGWNGFESTSAEKDAMRRQQVIQQRADEEARTGRKFEPKMGPLKQTWRRVATGEEAGERRVFGVSRDTVLPDTEMPLASNSVTIEAGHSAPTALASDPGTFEAEDLSPSSRRSSVASRSGPEASWTAEVEPNKFGPSDWAETNKREPTDYTATFTTA